MYISKINIENFKSFKGSFKLFLDRGINIVVGENEAGKSTIIEAIHLTLSGLLNGKYLNNELTQYIFNYEVVTEYLDNLNKGINSMPPHILIEIFIEGEDISEFEGNGNSEKTNSSGISLKIAFDEKYKKEYEDLIKIGGIKSLPITVGIEDRALAKSSSIRKSALRPWKLRSKTTFLAPTFFSL